MKQHKQNKYSTTAKLLIPPVIVAAMFLFMPWLSSVMLLDVVPIKLPPPKSLPHWKSSIVYYCQGKNCRYSIIDPPSAEESLCPECGGKMDVIPLAEREVLPPDTLIFRRRYVNDSGATISLVAVVSGESRSSIHKPEICLDAQGMNVVDKEKHQLEINNVELDLAFLDLRTDTSEEQSTRAMLVYWFASPDTQTSSQTVKNWLMLKERLLKGRISRWAYVSMLVPYSGNRNDTVQTIDSFLKELYPRLALSDDEKSGGLTDQ